MPLVKVNMLAGKTPEFKKIVFDCIHQGLIDTFGIADWSASNGLKSLIKLTGKLPKEKPKTL